MKILPSILAGAATVVLLAGTSFAADSHAACCKKAKDAGKECEHACCVAAKKENKECEKCNKPK